MKPTVYLENGGELRYERVTVSERTGWLVCITDTGRKDEYPPHRVIRVATEVER